MNKFYFEICRAGVVFETATNHGEFPTYNGRIFGTSYIGPNIAPPDGYVYRQRKGGANALPEDYAALDAAMELHGQISRSYERDSKKILVDGEVVKILLFGTGKVRYQWSPEARETIHDRNWNFDMLPELFVWIREGKKVEILDIPDGECFRMFEEALPERVRNCSLRHRLGFTLRPIEGSGFNWRYADELTPHCPECGAEAVSIFSNYEGHP